MSTRKDPKDPFYQQGDVLIVPIPASEWPARRQARSHLLIRPRPGNILAEGEATGHAHRIVPIPESGCTTDDIELLSVGGSVFFRILRGEARVIHEEHKPFTIPAGTYRSNIVREADHFAGRVSNVAD